MYDLIAGICDFQFLPMLTDKNGKMENICETILPNEVDGDRLKTWLESPAELFLSPAAFSRIDTQSLNVQCLYTFVEVPHAFHE